MQRTDNDLLRPPRAEKLLRIIRVHFRRQRAHCQPFGVDMKKVFGGPKGLGELWDVQVHWCTGSNFVSVSPDEKN